MVNHTFQIKHRLHIYTANHFTVQSYPLCSPHCCSGAKNGHTISSRGTNWEVPLHLHKPPHQQFHYSKSKKKKGIRESSEKGDSRMSLMPLPIDLFLLHSPCPSISYILGIFTPSQFCPLPNLLPFLASSCDQQATVDQMWKQERYSMFAWKQLLFPLCKQKSWTI